MKFISRLFPFLFATSDNPTIAAKDTATVHGLWWMDNKMGGYDGYEFRSNGELKLLNWDLFIGKTWQQKGDHLILEMIWRKDGKSFIQNKKIDLQTISELYLSEEEIVFEEPIILKTQLIRIHHNDFTDQYMGHWDAKDGTYLQVIPINSFRYQIVISDKQEQEPDKYTGDVNKEKKTIDFRMEDKKYNLIYKSTANAEILTFGKRDFFRDK